MFDCFITESVNEVFPNILKQLDRVKSVEIEYNQYHFQVRYSENDHCLYFFCLYLFSYIKEIEAVIILRITYLEMILIIFYFNGFHNYDEITQNMNDTQRSEINSMVTRVISRWATEYNISERCVSFIFCVISS
jgi:c-di-AMP phosphodiesterase-like protein